MPYVKIETNTMLDKDYCRQALLDISRAVAGMLNKPQDSVMLSLLQDTPIVFAGTSAPAAYLELKSIGLDEAACPELAAKLSELMHSKLGVALDRVYIEFKSLNGRMFGWNGKTF